MYLLSSSECLPYYRVDNRQGGLSRFCFHRNQAVSHFAQWVVVFCNLQRIFAETKLTWKEISTHTEWVKWKRNVHFTSHVRSETQNQPRQQLLLLLRRGFFISSFSMLVSDLRNCTHSQPQETQRSQEEQCQVGSKTTKVPYSPGYIISQTIHLAFGVGATGKDSPGVTEIINQLTMLSGC